MDYDGWHLWEFGGVLYARRLKTSPPVVITARTEKERDDKIAAYLKHGRAALNDE